MKTLARMIMLAAWLTGLVTVSVASADEKPTFVFTAIPDQDETRLAERFGKVATYLEQKLGAPGSRRSASTSMPRSPNSGSTWWSC